MARALQGLAPTFGPIPGYPEGSCFASRRELSHTGVHRPLVAGIAGRGRRGATSVVLAGGYEDTEDFGAVILYTGQGGRDPETRHQVTHQTLTRGNLALVTNANQGLPVRVIRGARQRSPYAPVAGYRYDGLYLVEQYWRERGKAGLWVWRFRLCHMTTPWHPDDDWPGRAGRENMRPIVPDGMWVP